MSKIVVFLIVVGTASSALAQTPVRFYSSSDRFNTLYIKPDLWSGGTKINSGAVLLADTSRTVQRRFQRFLRASYADLDGYIVADHFIPDAECQEIYRLLEAPRVKVVCDGFYGDGLWEYAATYQRLSLRSGAEVILGESGGDTLRAYGDSVKVYRTPRTRPPELRLRDFHGGWIGSNCVHLGDLWPEFYRAEAKETYCFIRDARLLGRLLDGDLWTGMNMLLANIAMRHRLPGKKCVITTEGDLVLWIYQGEGTLKFKDGTLVTFRFE
jgi:hypothetical protein